MAQTVPRSIARDVVCERTMKAPSGGSDWTARGPAPNDVIEGRADLRGSLRIVPRHRPTEVRLRQRLARPGPAPRISMSGAPLPSGAAPIPCTGTGIRIAPVLRPTEDGIAAAWAEPFTPERFDERVRP